MWPPNRPDRVSARSRLTFDPGRIPPSVVFESVSFEALLMAFGAFLFAHFALHAQSRRRRMLWSVLALLAVVNVMVIVKGRTGQLILVALALYFTYSAWRWRGALLSVAGITVVVVALALGPTSASRMSRTLDEWRDWRPGQATETATGLRLEFYQHGLAIVRDHPVIGVGTGGFAKAYAGRVAATELTPTTNPHSEYLNISIQLGVIGLAALLYLFYCEWRVAASLTTTPERQLARGLVITFVIGCLFNSLLMDHTEGLLFAWASGLLFAGLPVAAEIRSVGTMTLSVVVITKNEADVIGRCLESVAWADETIVLDSASKMARPTSPAGSAQRSKPRPIGRASGRRKTVRWHSRPVTGYCRSTPTNG